MWETSLGFLNQVMPAAVVQRMATAALCAGGNRTHGAGGGAVFLAPSTPVVRGGPQGTPTQRRAAMDLAETAGEEAQGEAQEEEDGSWEVAVSSLSSSGALDNTELGELGEMPGDVGVGGAAAVGAAGAAVEADAVAGVYAVAAAPGVAGAALGVQGGKGEEVEREEGKAGAAASKGAAAGGLERSWSGSSEVGSTTGGPAAPSQVAAKLGFEPASPMALSACVGLPEAQPVQPLKLLLPDIELEVRSCALQQNAVSAAIPEHLLAPCTEGCIQSSEVAEAA